jgi:putative ABC transport system substrate-binding protein
MINRRQFISLLGGGAVAWPIVAGAQQPMTRPIIGLLGTSSEGAWNQWLVAFVQGLRAHGWIEGRNIAIEYRWAEGREAGYAEALAEFIRLKASVIVTAGGALPAAMQATSVIPIVFAIAPDPLGSGVVRSLARPGGNITGLSTQATDLGGKRIELLREIMPGLRRLAIMSHAGYPPIMLELREVHDAVRALGLEAVTVELRSGDDIEPAFEMLKGRAEALYVPADPLVNSNRVRIGTLALDARLPTIFSLREYVTAGGLISYGPSIADLFRRAADYVDKILRGAKPADLPVEQPTKFELVINLKTATVLGLTVPPSLLARADEVLE